MIWFESFQHFYTSPCLPPRQDIVSVVHGDYLNLDLFNDLLNSSAPEVAGVLGALQKELWSFLDCIFIFAAVI